MAKKKRRRASGVAVQARPQQKPRAPRAEASTATPENGSRLAPLRRRAARVKLALVTVALVVFGVGVAATRASYAGHAKRPLRALAAPPGFVKIVRANLLQAGIVAPAQAPPGAATSVS
jgi:hypothetical protein